MAEEKVIIVGAGPCGMSAAIELQDRGIDPLILEKGNIVDTIYRYPTHQTFFSSSEKLEIGNVAFITAKTKPQRLDALAYYREVAKRRKLRIHAFETVNGIVRTGKEFVIHAEKAGHGPKKYQATQVILASGYYGQPNYMNIPGEQLAKVSHYFKEAHPFYQKRVAVVGGKNSAVDAALELYKAGAEVTVLYRGSAYSPSIKPWILPEFDSLIQKGEIAMVFHADLKAIAEDEIIYEVKGKQHRIENDFVFAMTGYHPDHELLKNAGVDIDQATGAPVHDQQTFETNVTGLYIAGVIAAGYNNNSIFIENGRFHGGAIAESIIKKS